MFKILVVDDDDVQRQIYEAVFQVAKFTVITAKDGQQGWDEFLKEKPDAVFTGIMMPKLDGFTLTQKIREKSPGFPVIIFSHLGRPEDREKAKEANVDFMVKGFDSPAEILKRMQELLDMSEYVKFTD